MGKDLNSHFSQISSESKGNSTQNIRVMKVKTVKCHFTLTRMAATLKTDDKRW